MSSELPDSDLGMTRQLQIDAVCVQFEQELRAGKWPRIEAFLQRHDEPLRSQLLKHLLQIELEYRVEQGERLEVGDFLDRFPHDQSLIHIVRDELSRSMHAPDTEILGSSPSAGKPGDSSLSRSDSSLHGRFLPGTKIANRYRIVSLLGKGGMGEVYRADDLRLGHTVALKFLPKKLARDPERLERFQAEVRLTRQISHPNVCRVYDMDEVDGQQFLSMEFIDGEDLRILLRRIGRLPKDKGIQIAQQLCAGLAAAHDKGVLHRDLKPANIMIDGHGQVRITDFGLAKLASDDQDAEVAGTPAYMAPEQLRHGETTIQSDLYSLGLILHEVFTGEAVHKANSIPELIKQHEDSAPSQPSSVVDDMDPVVERVILRCLEKQPHERPKSAHAVANSLPGGDPLAAALAAGETPSPQMVAAAEQDVGLTVRGIVGVMIALLVLLPVKCWVADRTDPVNQSGLKDEPAVLAAEARQIISEDLGYDEAPYDEAHGMHIDEDGNVEFWLRQNDDVPFVVNNYWTGFGMFSRVRPDWRSPPWGFPGERGLVLDSAGRLWLFRAVPRVDTSTGTNLPDPDWSAWFPSGTIGFRLAKDNDTAANEANDPSPLLMPVDDRFRTPPDAFDAVGVWTGVDPDTGGKVFVEAAAFRGRPTYFQIFPKEDFEEPLNTWAMLHLPDDNEQQIGVSIFMGLFLILLVAGVVLAWHNLRSGRGDRRGALRLAGCVFCLETVVWLSHTRHLADLTFEVAMVITIGVAQVLFETARAWVWYIALEPFARHVWPRVLICWSRLLDGRFRNPLVGRDLLLGVLAGVCTSLLVRLNVLVQTDFGDSQPIPIPTHALALDGTKELFGLALEINSIGILTAMFLLFILVVLRIVLRTERRAIVGAVAILTTFGTLAVGGNLAITVVPMALEVGLTIAVLVRLGFLAVVVEFATRNLLLGFPLTADVNHWYFSHGLFAVAWISGLALYGCYALLGGKAGLAQPALH